MQPRIFYREFRHRRHDGLHRILSSHSEGAVVLYEAIAWGLGFSLAGYESMPVQASIIYVLATADPMKSFLYSLMIVELIYEEKYGTLTTSFYISSHRPFTMKNFTRISVNSYCNCLHIAHSPYTSSFSVNPRGIPRYLNPQLSASIFLTHLLLPPPPPCTSSLHIFCSFYHYQR